ncbi:hypothetical protein [Sediminicurvatus halobius]|uniref:hypothetical protein n=1 Tax=Sediminicurvatus halobius TaxID=2182432 RepID=UPI001304A1C6|nr:hypothetical protein [Spiribacter halobius]UEX76675.1 DUF4347 domain-containing protein [Spiribacter halobius]
MTRRHIYSYFDPDFYSANAPACPSGNAGDSVVPLRAGMLRWDRSVGFDDLADLVRRLDVLSGGNGEPVGLLGVLCHGRPGALRVLSRASGLLTIANLSSHGPALRGMNAALHRNQGAAAPSPLVVFLACSAAAGTSGRVLFEAISTWMPGTRVVGFQRLLTLDATRPRERADGSICLPPDVRVTPDVYDPERPIAGQEGSSYDDPTSLPFATPEAVHAREFRDGELWRDTADGAGGNVPLRAPTRAGAP